MSKYLETLPQYHFDRDDFCKVFGEVFTDDEIIDIDVMCGYPQNTDNFLLYRWEDEFYIIHRDSGTIINWYKHLGRTNTCNKEGFTLADLKELLLLLKEDLKEVEVYVYMGLPFPGLVAAFPGLVGVPRWGIDKGRNRAREYAEYSQKRKRPYKR